MSNLTGADVENALNNSDNFRWGFDWSELAWEGANFDHLEVNGENYSFEILESEDGSEGDWETATWVVVKVGDQVFRKEGVYASHVGTEWEPGLAEVKAVQKTITVWETK